MDFDWLSMLYGTLVGKKESENDIVCLYRDLDIKKDRWDRLRLNV